MNPDDGKARFSPVMMWLDVNESGEDLFVELTTESNLTIRLTSSHLIYVSDDYYELINNEASTNSNTQTNHNRTNVFTINPNNNSTNSTEYDKSTLNNQPTINNNVNSKTTSRVDQYTYTTYARNAIIGQYLLTTTLKPTAKSKETKLPTITQSEKDNYNLAESDHLDRDSMVYSLIEDSSAVDQQPTFKSDDVQLSLDRIVSINYNVRLGIYAPLTRDGNLVVNSLVASCYAVISDHDLAHLSFLPVRWYYSLKNYIFDHFVSGGNRKGRLSFDQNKTPEIYRYQSGIDRNMDTHEGQSNDKVEAQEKQVGVHWYPSILYRLARILLPTSYLY